MDYARLFSSQPAIGIYILIGGFLVSLFTIWFLSKKLPGIIKTDDFGKSIKLLLRPLLVIIPVLLLKILQPVIRIDESIDKILSQVLNISLISALALLAIRITGMFRIFLTRNYNINHKDNLNARKIFTQARVIERILKIVIGVIAFSAILMSFDKVRQLGVSLLASAGIISVIAGLAAQKSIAALFAGIQIAVSQPIRIDDSVIVEKEWGWIEEINLTYVVVKLWDLRRIIMPITYFIDHPFQNWTRTTANLLGSVQIYTDYTIPVQNVRNELLRILESTRLWDKKTWNLQVTDTREQTLELRAVMSAENASDAWDLKCLVREKLVEFIQDKYPQCLPRVRLEMKQK